MTARSVLIWAVIDRTYISRQPERDQFRGYAGSRASHGDDQILDAIEHIGHRISGLRGMHLHAADFFAGRLVVGVQHGAEFTRRTRRQIPRRLKSPAFSW